MSAQYETCWHGASHRAIPPPTKIDRAHAADDARILEVLEVDSWLPRAEIAPRVGMPPQRVQYALVRLMEQRAIERASLRTRLSPRGSAIYRRTVTPTERHS